MFCKIKIKINFELKSTSNQINLEIYATFSLPTQKIHMTIINERNAE